MHNTYTVDTTRRLVTSTGPSVKTWGHRLLTGTVNLYLKGSQMPTVPLLCGTYRLSQFEPYAVLHGIKKKTWLLIDRAAPDDSNVNK